MLADQHVEKQHGQSIRILVDQPALFLLPLDPLRDNRICEDWTALEEQTPGPRKGAADRYHKAMEFQDRWRQHHRDEGLPDLGQLLLERTAEIDVDRECDVVAFLTDDGFEQALLAAEPGVDRGLRTAGDSNDVVDRNVVVTLFQKHRRGKADQTFAARIRFVRACGSGLRLRRFPTLAPSDRRRLGVRY